MIDIHHFLRRSAVSAGCLGLLGMLVLTGVCLAEPAKGADKAGAAVGKLITVPGTLLLRQADGKGWKTLKEGDAVPADQLLIAVPRAEMDSANGAVRLTMLADITRRLPEPVLESAVILKANPEVDLDFMLERGIILLTSQREKGNVNVRVRFRNQVWDLVLKEAGTFLVMGINSRHMPGLRDFVTDPAKPFQAGDPPLADVKVLVIKGKAELDIGDVAVGLRAPPGPARFHWNSLRGNDRSPESLEKLPDTVKPLSEEEQKKVNAVYERARRLANKPIEAAFKENLGSTDPIDRAMAVIGFGAIDDLPNLIGALSHPKHPEVRDLAVQVLRHWVGRSDGQEEKLYHALRQGDQFTATQANSVLQLLYGCNEVELARPEVYQVLIALLKHEKLAFRELAQWHLYRLAPAGKDIAYDAAGPAEQREQAYKKWKALIPHGELPPEPKAPPGSNE